MIRGDTAGTPIHTDSWRSALASWRDNPLYVRLSLSRRRQESRTSKLAKFAALLIAILPAGLAAGSMLLGKLYVTSVDIADAVNGAFVAYIITACVVWFAQAFHQFVLDCMLLLNRSKRKQLSVTLDDLEAVSGMSNREIAVGALAALLPGLWLRILVAAAGALVVFLGFQTEFLTDVNNETHTALLFAGPAVAATTLGGALATIALGLYLISMSENYSYSLAGAAAVLYSLGALFWISFSAVLAFVSAEFTGRSGGGLFGSDEQQVWMASQLSAPVVYILLVWLALILVNAVRWLRPVYALGSPWLNPVLLVIAVMSLLVFGQDYRVGEMAGISMLVLVYQFGTFAPLSMTHLPTVAMLGSYLEFEGILAQLAFYAVHVAVQLLLIVVCARYALIAIENRRQSPLS